MIQNSSFEIYSSCPIGGGQLNKAAPWFNPTGNTPDFFHTCSPNINSSVLTNNWGYQAPKKGKGYGGFATIYAWFGANGREYIEQKLIDSLMKDRKYCVSFFVSLSNMSGIATNNLGAYFTNDSLINYSTINTLSYSPHINETNVIKDTMNWILISGNLIAKGGEKFITIGNFYEDINTKADTIISPFTPYQAYYYIDNTSVVETKESHTGKDTLICIGNSVALGKPAEPGLMYSWWPATGLNCTTCPQPVASPDVTTTYYLIVNDTNIPAGANCPCKCLDTVLITVKNCDTAIIYTNDFFIPTAFSPNGDNNNDVLFVYGKNIETLELEIYSRWGEKIYDGRFTDYDLKNGGFETWNGKSNNENAEPGVYVWYVKMKFKKGEEKTGKGNVTLIR